MESSPNYSVAKSLLLIAYEKNICRNIDFNELQYLIYQKETNVEDKSTSRIYIGKLIAPLMTGLRKTTFMKHKIWELNCLMSKIAVRTIHD